jgi:hypothetical protein
LRQARDSDKGVPHEPPPFPAVIGFGSAASGTTARHPSPIGLISDCCSASRDAVASTYRSAL